MKYSKDTLIANITLTVMSIHDEMRSLNYALADISTYLNWTEDVLDEDAIVNYNRIADEHIDKIKQLNKEILNSINNSIAKEIKQ